MAFREHSGRSSSFPRHLLLLAALSLGWSSCVGPAGTCPDNDGDDFVVCGACTLGSGQACGECDDGDSAIHPGAAERCDDALDNNCDGDVNEGFSIGEDCALCDGPDCPASFCVGGVGPLETCSSFTGDLCLTGSLASAGNGIKCDPGGVTQSCEDHDIPKDIYAPEGQGPNLRANLSDRTCGDLFDNDCDELVDRDDPDCTLDAEILCDGIDDNGNSLVDETFTLDAPCTEGVGACENSGVTICTADRTSTMCSVEAFLPIYSEDAPGEPVCADGIDNDCDGLTDLEQESCRATEICDLADNDGDHQIDEDFPDLGEDCTSGVSDCRNEGIRVCSPDGSSTICSVVASPSSPEGPLGITCSDGADNDCDKATDMDDPGCLDPTAVVVSCALEPINPNKFPWTDCDARFIAHIEHNLGDGADVSAELMGLLPNGHLIPLDPSSVPIQDGDEVHMASRIDPSEFGVSPSGRYKVDVRGRYKDVFAPIPLLVVTAKTGDRILQAFCSHVAYLDVLEPNGDVVTASEGDITEVVVAIPRVDPTTLSVHVDGVDLLAGLGIDPVVDFPGGPYSGSVLIDGETVTVSDLIIDTAELNELGANKLTMIIENLGGGGHIVMVNGDPCDGQACADAVPEPASAPCHLDNIADAGMVDVFEVILQEPDDGDLRVPGSTQVLAEVKHGRDIESAAISGVAAPFAAQVCTTTEYQVDDETFMVGECVANIDEMVDQTDFTEPLHLGTFDLGQNDVTVSAKDDLQNLAYDTNRFIMGDTVSPQRLELTPLQVQQIQNAAQGVVQQQLQTTLEGQMVTLDAVSFDAAFSFGITTDALNTFFQSTCDKALALVRNTTTNALMNAHFPPINIDMDIIDVSVQIQTVAVNFGGDLTCNVIPQDGFMTVKVALPTIGITVSVRGSNRVEIDLGLVEVCLISVTVDTTSTTSLSGVRIEFDISENLALRGGQADPRFVEGLFDQFTIDNEAGVQIGCFVGFLLDALNFITFGLLDVEEMLSGAVEGVMDAVGNAVQQALRSAAPDPLEVQRIQVSDEEFVASGLLASQELVSVRITPAGLTGTIGMSIVVPQPDPEVGGLPAATLTPVEPPELPVAGMKDIYFAASDDVFGLLFAALTLKGNFKTDCAPAVPEVTVGDLLPPDCTALPGPNERGRCHGAKGAICTALPFLERTTCALTKESFENRNVSVATPLLFCGREPIAPRMLIHDDLGTPSGVEATVHVNDLPLSIALDRDGDGVLGQPFLTTLPCFGLLAGDTKTDCKWARGCFDLDLEAELTVAAAADGDPQIVRTILGVEEQVGYQCAGGVFFGGEQDLLEKAGTSDPVAIISDNIGSIVPNFEAERMNLGGIVNFVPGSRMVLSIDTGVVTGDDCATCNEFVGVTGEIDPP